VNAIPLGAAELQAFIRPFLERRERYLEAWRKHGSPLYLIDERALRERAARFLGVFGAALGGGSGAPATRETRPPRGSGAPRESPATPAPGSREARIRTFYALKSNSHPDIARILVGCGIGLDVSSGRELSAALAGGASRIVFSGPGKTAEELALALEHAGRVTLFIDSFGELERLIRAAREGGRTLRAGVRLTSDERGLWRKFGIPLDRLGEFVAAAAAAPHVQLRGLQFHTSWNLDSAAQVAFLARLGRALGGLPEFARALEFIDIGGGYWPEAGEWLHSPDGATVSPERGVAQTALVHYRRPAASLETFAAHIAQAVRIHIEPHANVEVWLEPGRWLCHDGLHLLLQVIDVKAPDLVVTDAGTNAVGWERFETDYFPVLNLSRPAFTEHACFVLGSLCTPHDVWGYSYWGSGIAAGDILLIPAQGAYTYGLRQEFIKPLPRSAALAAD